MTIEELEELIQEVYTRAPSDYTLGYLDALNYILEWLQED